MKSYTLGECLKEAREVAQISQVEAQRLSGIKREYISRLENGHLKNTTAETLKKLATAYGLTVSDLLEGY